MKKNISQSLMKDYLKVVANPPTECGVRFEAIHIKRNYPKITGKAMLLGQYFEYLLTGAKPSYGDPIPEPEYTKTGMKKDPDKRTENDMTADWKRIHQKIPKAKQLIHDMGITIKSVGEERSRNGKRGTADICGSYKGSDCVIDIKYSGLLDNRYETFGWGAIREESYYGDVQRDFHGVQAMHYMDIFEVEKFYYLVFNSGDKWAVEMFEMSPSPRRRQMHEEQVNMVRSGINMMNVGGYPANPDFNTCYYCALKNRCKEAHLQPEPKVIELMAK